MRIARSKTGQVGGEELAVEFVVLDRFLVAGVAGVADPGQPPAGIAVDADDRMADSGHLETVGLNLVG